jgi:hypothetical protein
MARQPPTPPDPKDRGQLSIQVDATTDLLPTLLVEVRRQSNEAIRAGNLDQSDKLDAHAGSLALAFQLFLRHQIQEIDSSAEMRRLIADLSKINKDIQAIVAEAQQTAAFLRQLAGITTGINTIAGKVLK